MAKINWKVRFKNSKWVISGIPLILAMIVLGASIFGLEIDLNALSDKLIAFAVAVFAVVGWLIDPTTAGIGDSEQALTYTEPKK
jgi:phi LC3 family holin